MSQETETPALSEVPLALVLLVFSLAAATQAYGISGFDSISGPGVLPMLAAGVMVLSAFVLLVRALGAASPDMPMSQRLTGFFRYVLPVRVLAVVGLMVVYLYAMTRLGFMLSSGLFLFINLLYLWQRGLVKAALVTVLSLVLIWLVFRTVFQVVLPQGSWLTGVF